MKLDLGLKIIAVQYQYQATLVPATDTGGAPIRKNEKIIKVVARDDSGNILSFAVPYLDGNQCALDDTLTVSVSLSKPVI